jgi:hypothetical protein
MTHPKLGSERACIVCGRSFYKPPSNPAKACSEDCAKVLRRQNAGRPRLAQPQTCQVCNHTFYKPPSHLAVWPGKTCSRACAAVLRWKDRIERTCEHCGKTFKARRLVVAKGFGIYCSNKCNGAAFKRLVNADCAHCYTTFAVPVLFKLSGHKLFCCMACWKASSEQSRLQGIRPPYKSSYWTEKQRRDWRDTKCARCGSTERLELDHIIPRFMGGPTTRENSQTLCRPCNRSKFWDEDLLMFTQLKKSNVLGG